MFSIFSFFLTTDSSPSLPSMHILLLYHSMDGGAWWAAVYGVAQSRTRLKRISSSSIVSKKLYTYYNLKKDILDYITCSSSPVCSLSNVSNIIHIGWFICINFIHSSSKTMQKPYGWNYINSSFANDPLTTKFCCHFSRFYFPWQIFTQQIYPRWF